MQFFVLPKEDIQAKFISGASCNAQELPEHGASTANNIIPLPVTNHHEHKNKKTTSQIKFLAVTLRQWIKLVLQHSLCE